MKYAIIRWKQKTNNLKYQKAPMRIEDVSEIGEGAHFIHIMCNPRKDIPITEVNLNQDMVESITVIEETDLPLAPGIFGPDGKPIGVEAQIEEQFPVTEEAAGASPVDPANS